MSSADAVRFDHWMQLALYGPNGFYTTGGGRAGGREGAFITSPEVGPLYGAVLARLIDAEADRLGNPDDFTVYDVGAGPGTLARAVLAERPGTRYVCVEISEAQRALHPPDVESRASLPLGPLVGIVIANELLDNLPFRLAVNDGGWREAWVVEQGDRALEVLRPFDDVPPVLPDDGVPLGARAPLLESAGAWVADVVTRLRAGRLVVVDYCSPTTAALVRRPWREWLRTYRDHERGGHYLTSPGRQDITAEVAIDQLAAASRAPDEVTDQATFLARWGIADLVEEGRRTWQAAAHSPGLAAMRGRSRVRESEALTDPSGLGGFSVLQWIA